MPTALIDKDTVLKLSNLPLSELKEGEFLCVKKDEKLKLIDHHPEKFQHRWLRLSKPIKIGETSTSEVLVYDPHVLCEGEEKEKIKLKCSYFHQVDNSRRFHGTGYRQCNLTSHAMFVEWATRDSNGIGELTKKAKVNGYRQPEDYYGAKLAPYGDTTDHQAHTRCLREVFGIKSYWSYSLGLRDIALQLARGYPVPIGVAYKSSGHIVLIVGIDYKRQIMYIHDPFGIRHGASNRYDIHASGAFDVYSFATLDRIFWDGGSEAGWGRIVTSVRGVPTGMTEGL